MATLTETAYYTRKGVIWLGIATIAFFVLRSTILWGIDYYRQTHPAIPPLPTVPFGKLSGLVFPKKDEPTSLVIRLETKEGGLPTASTSARVFFIPRQLPNLLAVERAQEFASRLGFRQEPLRKTATIFQFKDIDRSRTLFLDTITNNFKLSHTAPLTSDILGLPPIQPEQAIRATGDFFSSLGILPATIDKQLARSQLLHLEDGKLVEATSLSTTQAIRVDLFEKSINGLPVVTPDFIHSLIYAIYTGRGGTGGFIEIGFTHFKVDLTTSGTYPLKTVEQAFDELQKGLGYIANQDKVRQEAVIRRLYLGYYQSLDYQSYLQPVFVFEGDNQFAAYLPAITAKWVNPPQFVSAEDVPLRGYP